MSFKKFKLEIFITVFVLWGISFAPVVWANGPANVYQVRISKMELWNGTSWVTVFEGTSTAIDIASVNSGTVAGQFLSGLSVPDGTYTQCRVTPSQVFNIKGNDGARFTTATNGANGGCQYTANSALEATCTVTISTPIDPDVTTFSSPITMQNGAASHKIRVSFDTSSAVQYNALADELFPSTPTVTVTVIAL